MSEYLTQISSGSIQGPRRGLQPRRMGKMLLHNVPIRVAYLLHWFDIPTQGYRKGLHTPKAGTFDHPYYHRAGACLAKFRAEPAKPQGEQTNG